MADENTQPTETPQADAPVSASQSIGQKVAANIADAGPAILGKVIDKLASAEIEKRADALLNAVNAAIATKRELYKVKPDLVAYNADGKVASENWTKPKLEEKKKLEEKLAKIEAAVDKAVNKNDFSGVLGLKTSE